VIFSNVLCLPGHRMALNLCMGLVRTWFHENGLMNPDPGVQSNVGLRFRKSVEYIRHEEVTAEKRRLDLNNPRISIRGIQRVCGAPW
jgi:hypothetical protein